MVAVATELGISPHLLGICFRGRFLEGRNFQIRTPFDPQALCCLVRLGFTQAGPAIERKYRSIPTSQGDTSAGAGRRIVRTRQPRLNRPDGPKGIPSLSAGPGRLPKSEDEDRLRAGLCVVTEDCVCRTRMPLAPEAQPMRYFECTIPTPSRDGGTGRRSGLKIRRPLRSWGFDPPSRHHS